MDTVDFAKATGLAVVLVCSACQFESGPLSSHGDGEPVATMMHGAQPQSPFDNPAIGSGMASPGSQLNGGAPAVIAPPPNVGNPVAGSSADPGSGPDAAAAEPPPAETDPAAPPDDPAPNGDASLPEPDAAIDPSDAGSPSVPTPGSVFSACLRNADCDQGLVCTTTLASFAGTPMTVGYCATYCSWSDGTANACPQPATGLVKSSCYPGTGLCLLESCDRSVCPTEMECVQLETPIGGGLVRTDFVCQP